MKGAKPRPPRAGVRRRRSTPQPTTARPRPGCLVELRKASCSPSAPAKQKWRSYRAARRLSSEDDVVAHPYGDQGNNKSSTNRRPRYTDSDSRTKRVNFCPGQRTGLQDCRVVLEPFLSRPPPGAQSTSESVSCRIASAPAARLCRSGHPASSLVAEALPPPEALCSDPGRGRRDRAQMEPESATRLVVRFAALKAIHIRGAAAPSSRHGAQCVNSA